MQHKVNESILNDEIREHQKENRIDHMTYLARVWKYWIRILMDRGDQRQQKHMTSDSYTAADVKRALLHTNRTPEDFGGTSITGSDCRFWKKSHKQAQQETRKHFGNSVYMFTPIYIANYCENYCIYCGFNCHNKIHRAKLNADEIEKEMQEIAETGLQEILILTGESPKMSDMALYRRSL